MQIKYKLGILITKGVTMKIKKLNKFDIIKRSLKDISCDLLSDKSLEDRIKDIEAAASNTMGRKASVDAEESLREVWASVGGYMKYAIGEYEQNHK